MHNKKIKIRKRTCKYTTENALHIPSYIIFPPRDFEEVTQTNKVKHVAFILSIHIVLYLLMTVT